MLYNLKFYVDNSLYLYVQLITIDKTMIIRQSMTKLSHESEGRGIAKKINVVFFKYSLIRLSKFVQDSIAMQLWIHTYTQLY